MRSLGGTPSSWERTVLRPCHSEDHWTTAGLERRLDPFLSAARHTRLHTQQADTPDRRHGLRSLLFLSLSSVFVSVLPLTASLQHLSVVHQFEYRHLYLYVLFFYLPLAIFFERRSVLLWLVDSRVAEKRQQREANEHCTMIIITNGRQVGKCSSGPCWRQGDPRIRKFLCFD